MPSTTTRSEETAQASPAILPDREHRDGCPGGRVERYPDRVPASAKGPALDVVVIRCVDCGGHLVKPAPRS